MQAFKLVMTGLNDAPYPEGVVILKQNGIKDPQKQEYLMIGPKMNGYIFQPYHVKDESVFRTYPKFEKITVPDGLWQAAENYYKELSTGDSKSAEAGAAYEFEKLLGPKLRAFIHVGGAT